MVWKVHLPWFLFSERSVSHGTFGLQSITSLLLNCIVRISVNSGFFLSYFQFIFSFLCVPCFYRWLLVSNLMMLCRFWNFYVSDPSPLSSPSWPPPRLCPCSFLKLQSNRNAPAPTLYTAVGRQLPRFGTPLPDLSPLLHLTRFCHIHLHQAQPFCKLQNEIPSMSSRGPPLLYLSCALAR